ncbi:MAG TPA: SLC13 family permease [Gammaproteobacteria bacterium]
MLLTLGALFLFTRERIPLEYSCVAVLVVMVLGFELFPYYSPVAHESPLLQDVPGEVELGPSEPTLRGADFLLAFGNEALITICLLLIVAKGVEVSGVLRPLGRLLVRLWSRNRTLALLFTLAVTAMISAFMNNTPIVVMLLPMLVGVAHRVGMAPSRVLMPFCFATTIGGMTTTIGSSTNLLVVGVAADLGLPPIRMFDFLLPAAIGAAAGLAYLWLVAPRLLKDRPSPLAAGAPRVFYAVVEIDEDSRFVGRPLSEVTRLMEGPTRLERVQRRGLEIVRLPSLTLRPGDKLHIRGSAEAIKRIQDAAGGSFPVGHMRRGRDQRLAEIVVTNTSPLLGKRLSELRRGVLGDLYPVAIQRPGPREMIPIDEAGDPELDTGDVLLMQGHSRDIQRLKQAHNVLVLDRTINVPRTAQAPLATAILAGVVLAAAFDVVPILVAALSGVVAMLATRCLHWDEAWSAIDTRLVLVIVTSLGLGTMLSGTGATAWIAERFVAMAQDLSPPIILSAFLLMMALLNELISNNAVAVICTPIGVGIAEQLGVPAFPFVVAVLFGANVGFITPIGYQTNLLVFTAGGYKFGDFFRVGAPLLLVMWLTLSVALSILYL